MKAKPPQFSIRLMLVVVTALCIALGVWGSRAERQRRAVKAVEEGYGRVRYGREASETFLRRWLPRDYFDDVESVFHSGTAVTDDTSVHLEAFPKLRILRLVDTRITDAGLAHLEGMKLLGRLSLYKTQITDAALVHLQGLSNLRRLDLRGTRVTEQGVARLQNTLPECEILTDFSPSQDGFGV